MALEVEAVLMQSERMALVRQGALADPGWQVQSLVVPLRVLEVAAVVLRVVLPVQVVLAVAVPEPITT
jgi:hypothetical protein